MLRCTRYRSRNPIKKGSTHRSGTFFDGAGQSRQIGDAAADGRVADDVVDAQVDGELLLVERLGLGELIGVIVLDAREEVLPCLER